jgi:hypothetical protein
MNRMNRAQFFATLKLTRANLEVVQVDDKGFMLQASIQHDDEVDTIALYYKDEPRYFKSVNSVVDIIKDEDYQMFGKAGSFAFTVTLNPQAIKQEKRGPRSTTPATKTASTTTKKDNKAGATA